MKQIACIAAVMAALSLAACGGGGSSEPPKAETPQVELEEPTQSEMEAAKQAAREKAQREAEQAAREQAERERLAREEAERLALEEQERLERESAGQEERERLEREAAERAALAAARLPFPFRPRRSVVFPAFWLSGLPNPQIEDVGHSPVYRDRERLFVGVDHGTPSNRIRSLPVVGERNGGLIMRHGHLSDGPSESEIRSYLEQAGIPGHLRFDSAPIVQFVGDTSDRRLVERTLEAIRLVNSALPQQFRMTVPTLAPIGVFRRRFAQPNTIYIEFVDQLSSAGRAFVQPLSDGSGIHNAYVRLRTGSQFGGDEYFLALTLVSLLQNS